MTIVPFLTHYVEFVKMFSVVLTFRLFFERMTGHFTGSAEKWLGNVAQQRKHVTSKTI